MWRPIFRQEHLKAGDRLRKELLTGEEFSWTEYEVVEADAQGLVLRPLFGNEHTGADNVPVYKNVGYDVLYGDSTRIWVTMEKPEFRA